ncbi:NAD/NADP octopine/nopaline dehydrogenase [Aureimonas fodinaquatilis]|uniref:NAD/NADP octopine/nopaline dehydrogenase n=1 Tax=Aureimonas fodinaquatilis TaxID=2565783 RepID=A0A5B0E1A2_9HYPH|nr:NAD/NADP-dependent octopine/nopaline dehydrogenase family protein [Aureimonas fodinaquatilis]KAA0971751.1 NAD/NADP octopine/nopaline dehydrogenase [Aureimonas fodinaquatilis]
MKLAILGAGAMGLTAAAVATSRGHEAVLWSPSGKSTTGLAEKGFVTSTGAIEGNWPVKFGNSIDETLANADAVLLAVDANGHRGVMEAAAPHMKSGVPFIVSAAHSLSGLYLAQLLAMRGTDAPVVSWNTSAGTAHRTANGAVDIRVVRSRIEASVTPASASADAMAMCRALFPAHFEERASALEIGLLANCNPVFHVPVCLANIARIENGEHWAPYEQTTPAAGRLMEALDGERIAIANAYGFDIHSVNEHFHRSFKTPLASMDVMNATLHAVGRGPKGPMSVQHRYLMQDIPYGLVFAAAVGRIAAVPTPVHDATILLASTMLDFDFAGANTILEALDLGEMSRNELTAFANSGHRPTMDLRTGTSQ